MMQKIDYLILLVIVLIFMLMFMGTGCTQAIKTPPGYNITINEKTGKKPYGLRFCPKCLKILGEKGALQ